MLLNFLQKKERDTPECAARRCEKDAAMLRHYDCGHDVPLCYRHSRTRFAARCAACGEPNRLNSWAPVI